jgi:hypothetical protein
MKTKNRFWPRVFASSVIGTLLVVTIGLTPCLTPAFGGSPMGWWRGRQACNTCGGAPFCGAGEEPPSQEVGGAWYWLRSPEQEKRVVISHFNHYCIRCHGIDGRGVWDIPDVPDFTNARWQACRTDGQLARAILEGRGAVMPPWRGTLSLEEAWAMGRYVRTFAAGTGASRPDVSTPEKPASAAPPAKSTKPPTTP